MSLKIQTRIGGINDAEAISVFVSALAERHIALTLDHNGIDALLISMNAKAMRHRICGDFRFILRGIDLDVTRNNMVRMIRQSQDNGDRIDWSDPY